MGQRPSTPAIETSHDFEIIISGAGLAGLALARRLEQLGFRRLRIFERDASLACRQQGYSLTIQEPGKRALRRLGLLDSVRASATSAGGGQRILHAADGRCLEGRSIEGEGEPKAAKTGGKRNLYVPRQELRRILAESLETQIAWGEHVTGYRADGALEVQLSGHKCTTASLLVACDGVASAVRRQKLEDELLYLGVCMINGLVDTCPFPACRAGNLQLVDGRARMFLKPFGAGAMWQLTFPAEPSEVDRLKTCPKEELQRRALEETEQWLPAYRDMVQATELSTLRGGGLFDHDPQACGHAGPANNAVAVIGDAAHAMSPFMGQGANQALTDAVLLAECLDDARKNGGLDPMSLHTCLASFHKSMAERVQQYVLESRRRVEFFHRDLRDFASGLKRKKI